MTTKLLLVAALMLVGTGTAFGVVRNDKNRVIDGSAGAVAAAPVAVASEKAAPAAAGETKAGGCCTFADVTTTVTNDKGRSIGSSTKSVMSCGSCKSALENLMTTGKFVHTCTMSGAAKCH